MSYHSILQELSTLSLDQILAYKILSGMKLHVTKAETEAPYVSIPNETSQRRQSPKKKQESVSWDKGLTSS